MSTLVYFDCFSGASGDMLLGSLLDAGFPLDTLREDIRRLGLQDVRLECQRQTRRGITGTQFTVIDDSQGRAWQNLAAMRDLVSASDLSDRVKANSLKVLTLLAQAEAGIHGVTIDEVHFHEVGAVDTLVDVVGFCAALERLQIEAVYCSPLPTGGGAVATAHGLLPVPAPATLALLAGSGATLLPSEARGEMVTPTGAAILAGLARFEQPILRLQRVGYGFGVKEFPWANAIRAWLGDRVEDRAATQHKRPPHAHGDGTQHTHSHVSGNATTNHD